MASDFTMASPNPRAEHKKPTMIHLCDNLAHVVRKEWWLGGAEAGGGFQQRTYSPREIKSTSESLPPRSVRTTWATKNETGMSIIDAFPKQKTRLGGLALILGQGVDMSADAFLGVY